MRGSEIQNVVSIFPPVNFIFFPLFRLGPGEEGGEVVQGLQRSGGDPPLSSGGASHWRAALIKICQPPADAGEGVSVRPPRHSCLRRY